MPAALDHIDSATPMGASLVADGATFRVWAPAARAVYIVGEFNQRRRDSDSLLVCDAAGHWRGFVPGVRDRQRYMFYVVGEGSEGPKRDPYARELTEPDAVAKLGECVIRRADFPWRAVDYRAPDFSELLIYQLHVGVFFTPRWPRQAGTFLDVISKVPYLAELGITALQLLPIQEFPTRYSLGYNGTDYFAPERDFAVSDDDLPPYAAEVNRVLGAKGLSPYSIDDLRGEMNQLKALVDVCHAHGLAVVFDVVYNHAGGDFGDQSLYFFDRQAPEGGHRNSLYFTERGHAGGLVFDFAKPEVRDFLIQNARFLLDEYRADGLRYDQVSVIDHDGAPHGWRFCQDLTSTLRYLRPGALQHAEYWAVNPSVVVEPVAGAGFDTTLGDGLRIALRDVIAQASQPDERPLPMAALAQSLWPQGFDQHWRIVQGPENHDIVYREREPRIAKLADPGNARSWYARSRARVATGISLTAPGIPMLFMGQEFLEDKPWADDLASHANLALYWAGLASGDTAMIDHLRFTRELAQLRKRMPGLCGQGFAVVHASDTERVLAFQRWVPDVGQDVVVVAHLAPFHRYAYRVGFPGPGTWRELFNSDVFDHWVNPIAEGNAGAVTAQATALHGLPCSAELVLPANSLLVFAR